MGGNQPDGSDEALDRVGNCSRVTSEDRPSGGILGVEDQ